MKVIKALSIGGGVSFQHYSEDGGMTVRVLFSGQGC